MPFIALKKKQEDKPIKGNSKKADMPDFNEEKWVEFKKYFYQYAKRKGFNILKRKDFQNEREWRAYRTQFTVFYYNYVDHIKTLRAKQNPNNSFDKPVFFNYHRLIDNLNINFHYLTNYKFYQKKGQGTDKRKEFTLSDFI